MYKDGDESFINEESESCECNKTVGTELTGDAYSMVSMYYIYYYQKVQRN
ncbi:MAG: hypothetical protein MJ219_01320 [Mycoplasmoidaceae bacterium]|nr:hypothetical protein [Mycoplasmoidaceae bacterium]